MTVTAIDRLQVDLDTMRVRLPTPEQAVVESILAIAIDHDTVLCFLKDRMMRTHREDEDVIADYRFEVVEVCARLAPAAGRRVPDRVFCDVEAIYGKQCVP